MRSEPSVAQRLGWPHAEGPVPSARSLSTRMFESRPLPSAVCLLPHLVGGKKCNEGRWTVVQRERWETRQGACNESCDTLLSWRGSGYLHMCAGTHSEPTCEYSQRPEEGLKYLLHHCPPYSLKTVNSLIV